MRDASSNELVAFARRPHETLPFKYRHLPSPALDQSCVLELTDSDTDAWSLDTQHFRQ